MGFGKALALIVLLFIPAVAAVDSVADLFQQGRYEEAREALLSDSEGLRAGEAVLWEIQLADDPDDALVLLRENLEDGRLPESVRTRMALEIANIEFGLGRYQSALKALSPLMSDNQGSLPGDVYLRAGLTLRALGNPQKAREMLASVRPQDQSFLLARYYLGDIALDMKDSELALRYFESASGTDGTTPHPRTAGGQWRAYLAEGRDQEAAELERELSREHPGSLAMLDIQRARQLQEEELAAMVPIVDDVPTGTGELANRGRYALQLGAFSDRGLALEFMRRFQGQLPDLRIDEVRDHRGQFLYKVRTGAFVNPALARTEARRLADQLDMEVIVADLSDAGVPND